jgi:hypothetical protein
MLVSHRHRFIFVKTRKTGGTSLEIALSRELGADDIITPIAPDDEALRAGLGGRGPQHCAVPRERWGAREWWRHLRGKHNDFYNHMPARVMRRSLPSEVWDGYFKFTIERNPWDMAVSAYYWHHKQEPRPPLAEFLASRALRSYSNWPVYAIDGKVAVDEVIRYERLASALPGLATRLGLSATPSLPRAKGGFRQDRRPYQEVLGPRERDLVARVFAREIAAFGWTFD